jgi:signal transduction histidine kinase
MRPRPPGPARRRPLPPRRTARLRLTALYGGVCLAFGAVLLAVTYLLAWNAIVTHVVPQRAAGAGLHAAGPAGPQLQNGAAQIALDREQLLIQSAIALGIVSVAAVGAGWFLAGRVLRPLSTITAAARRISASSLHERLDLQGPDDELKELGDTLDGLLARLETSFDAQRRFAANASHELRTPLTRERTLLQVTLADPGSTVGAWRAVSRELLNCNAEQERLIEALLTLASTEVGLSQRETVDLAAITRATLAVPREGISRLGLNVRAAVEPATLVGDSRLIQQLVTNLVDNAVRHNVPGGEVQVATKTIDGRTILSVVSSGQVIPSAEVDRLFQPFQRFGPRRAGRDNGHGLGLSIVRAIAAAHGAVISPQPGPRGGLAIDVAFAASPAPSQPRWPDARSAARV